MIAVSENLPAVPADATLEGMVFNGEVADEDQAPEVPSSLPTESPARTLVVHPHVRMVAHHAVLTAAGVAVLLRRRQLARARAERMMRQAEAPAEQYERLGLEP